MKKPKITLKKISYYERMSEETNCFAADLYINGKKVGEAKNDGQGGCTDYRGNSKENDEIIKQTEQYFKSLPMQKSEYGFNYQPSLEFAIDDQFEAYLKAREEKKKQKLMETAILIGKPNSMTYTYIKQKVKLSQFPVDVLQPFIDKIKAQHCVDGAVILNTNLQKLGITV
jgi:hypothetical protein